MDHALPDDLLRAFQAVFPPDEYLVELPGHSAKVEFPYVQEGAGLVAEVAVWSNTTYLGPRGELVLVPTGALGQAEVALRGFRKRLVGVVSEGAAAPRDVRRLAEALGVEVPRDDAPAPAAVAADIARREASLRKMRERAPAVAAHVRELYGLRLPRHLAVYAAFLDSLSPLEARGLSQLDRRSGGIMALFEDGGLTRPTIDGLDARLDTRFRRDPPELVTVMWGDSDGLHFGLWYDDPAALPTCLAHNYARDSAETWEDEEATPLALLATRQRERREETLADWKRALATDEEEDGEAPAAVEASGDETDDRKHADDRGAGEDEPPGPSGPERALSAALAWFEEHDRRACVEDGAPKWDAVARPTTLGGLGPALEPRQGVVTGSCDSRHELYRKGREAAAPLFAEARAELAAGRPALAMVVGRELHWCDSEELEAECLELLGGAYRATGRDALAAILEVHHRHRDLASVGVYAERDAP